MTEPIDVTRLRWTVGEDDVTCENCHTAMYRPQPGEELCPTCRAALGEDLTAIHAQLADAAARRGEAA